MTSERELEPADGLVRLPGSGGAALMLRAHRVAAGWQDAPRSGLVLDIGLVDPLRHVHYLARPCSRPALERLKEFFFVTADHLLPEQSVPDFDDAALGVAISVVGSTDLDAELHVLVTVDDGSDVVDHDGLTFVTSRAALVAAAQRVSGLSAVPQSLLGEGWGGDV